MTSNSKKILIAVIGAVVVLALAAAYVLVNNLKTKDDGTGTDDSASAFEIYSISEENFKEIEIYNSSESFIFTKAEETEVNAEGKESVRTVYVCNERPNIILSQTKIKNMLYDFYSFYVKKLITEDMTRAEEYGFSETSPYALVTDINGVSTRLILGGKSPVDNSYYVMKEGENKIYLMSGSKAASFNNGFSEYRERTLGVMDSNTLLSFSVTDKGKRIIGIRYKNENDKEVVTTDLTTYVMTYPYTGTVRIDPFSKMMEPFTDVVVEDFVEDSLDNLSRYGLDNPLMAVLQDVDGNVHRLQFGNTDEKGNVYTLYNDYKLVFTTTPEMYNAVKDIDPFEYVEKFANIYSIDDVSNVTVSAEGRTYSLDIKKLSDDKSEYKINGKEAVEDGFKSVYQSVIGLMITGETDTPKRDSEYAVIEFAFNNGDAKKRTVIYEYDERNYGVLKNDGTYGLTLKKNVANMLDMLKELDEDPTVAP